MPYRMRVESPFNSIGERELPRVLPLADDIQVDGAVCRLMVLEEDLPRCVAVIHLAPGQRVEWYGPGKSA